MTSSCWKNEACCAVGHYCDWCPNCGSSPRTHVKIGYAGLDFIYWWPIFKCVIGSCQWWQGTRIRTTVMYQEISTSDICHPCYQHQHSHMWLSMEIFFFTKLKRQNSHDNVMKRFRHCWPFARKIHRVSAVMQEVFYLLAWTSSWTNIRFAGDLRRHHAHPMTVIPCISLQWRHD